MNNYAFIDGQNLIIGTKQEGWNINWHRLRVYLKEKYKVSKAFIFLGYLSDRDEFYTHLKTCDFIIVFKPVIKIHGKIKANCDADMILQIVTEIENYNRAVIITSDGDFYSTVRYLRENNKLEVVLATHTKKNALGY